MENLAEKFPIQDFEEKILVFDLHKKSSQFVDDFQPYSVWCNVAGT